MARKKTVTAIETEIGKVKSDMSKLQERYDKLAEKLKGLQGQKRQIEAEGIMDAYLKSNKTYDYISNIAKHIELKVAKSLSSKTASISEKTISLNRNLFDKFLVIGIHRIKAID